MLILIKLVLIYVLIYVSYYYGQVPQKKIVRNLLFAPSLPFGTSVSDQPHFEPGCPYLRSQDAGGCPVLTCNTASLSGGRAAAGPHSIQWMFPERVRLSISHK